MDLTKITFTGIRCDTETIVEGWHVESLARSYIVPLGESRLNYSKHQVHPESVKPTKECLEELKGFYELDEEIIHDTVMNERLLQDDNGVVSILKENYDKHLYSLMKNIFSKDSIKIREEV